MRWAFFLLASFFFFFLIQEQMQRQFLSDLILSASLNWPIRLWPFCMDLKAEWPREPPQPFHKHQGLWMGPCLSLEEEALAPVLLSAVLQRAQRRPGVPRHPLPWSSEGCCAGHRHDAMWAFPWNNVPAHCQPHRAAPWRQLLQHPVFLCFKCEVTALSVWLSGNHVNMQRNLFSWLLGSCSTGQVPEVYSCFWPAEFAPE